jgi:hypothetical protein
MRGLRTAIAGGSALRLSDERTRPARAVCRQPTAIIPAKPRPGKDPVGISFVLG